MDEPNIDEIKNEISQSRKMIEKADRELSSLKKELQSKGNNTRVQKLFTENQKLSKDHNKNLRYISIYQDQLDDLKKRFLSQSSEISSLKSENEKLKIKDQKRRNTVENKNIKPQIKNAKDLRKSFGFVLKKRYQNNDEEKEEEKDGFDTPGVDNKNENEFEKLKKNKVDSELKFYELKEKTNAFYQEIRNQETFIENYKNYINAINEQIISFRQQLNVSVIGEETMKFNDKTNDKVKDLQNNLEQVSENIVELKNIIYTSKTRTLKNIENILNFVQIKLSEIDKNKNITFLYLSSRIDVIQNKLDDLRRLCSTMEKNKREYAIKKRNIESNINTLKRNLERFVKDYQEGKKRLRDTIRKTIRRTGKNFFKKEDNNKNYEDIDECYEDEEEDNDQNDANLLRSSTLIGIDDFGKNADLFKSKILFNYSEQDENRARKPEILRKNWHEICYVYDDYDVHDCNFIIKAVGLGPFSFFSSCSNSFYMDKDIKILEFEIDGKRKNYRYSNFSLDYDIDLKNLESHKVHLKYKESPLERKLTRGQKEGRKFFRQDFYGLNESLSGQVGKFSLILKGSFDIVNFKDDFFVRNHENKTEKEYVWGGKIPVGGKRTTLFLSKKEAKWSFNCKTEICSRTGQSLKNTTLHVPLGFVGGNNEIININYSSPQTNDISVDEENREYEIKYKNTRYQKGEFILSGELKNRCKGEWVVDLTNEVIERNIPTEDKKDKRQLEQIAKRIISDFDRKYRENVKYLDYIKIGRWVKENIKYDLRYSGRNDLSAIDIYNKREGVCHHFTKLANALLYSLGYKVIYVNGFACDNNYEFDANSAHAWSLIFIKDKWYPFDSTWGIFSGKLPVCHVFQGFFGTATNLMGTDRVAFGDSKDSGKYLG